MKKSQPQISQNKAISKSSSRSPEHLALALEPATPAQIDRAERAEHTGRALMNYALRVLTRRAHTVFELRQKLEKRLKLKLGTSSDLIEKILLRLQDLHLLNDADYTERAIESAARFHGYGPYKISQKLAQKGISIEATRAAWNKSGFSEEEIALLALKKQSHRWLRLPKQERSIKQARFLASRGFSTGVIFKILRLTDI